jgi:hypothetical protein
MIEMSIRFGEGNGVVAEVADRTGWGLKSCQGRRALRLQQEV